MEYWMNSYESIIRETYKIDSNKAEYFKILRISTINGTGFRHKK